MQHYKKSYIILFLIIFFLTGVKLLAQTQTGTKGLIFNEVYLDKNQPTNSWIEIYNPTEKQLTLVALRYSNIKTTNILPDTIQQKGGIVINPGEYLLLSPAVNKDLKLFSNSQFLSIPVLVNFDDGGFIALTTKNMKESGIDAFTYGSEEKTKIFENYKNKPLVKFSLHGKSYSRKLTNTNGVMIISDFFETEPTKGSINQQ